MEVSKELHKYDESNSYPIEVRELRLIYKIPKSKFYEEVKHGTTAIAKLIHIDCKADFYTPRWFIVRCYPNGDCEKNCGFLSLKFEEDLSKMFYEPRSLHVTFALIDDERNLRFPQSFVIDYRKKVNHSREIGLSRYIKRSTLMDSDVFSEENLCLQCEVQYYRRNIFSDSWVDPFSWTTAEIVTTVGQILGDKSPYFKKLIKEGECLDSPNLNSIRGLTLVKDILMNTDQVLINLEDANNLYQFADYALMPELKEKCRDYFKLNMKPGIVFFMIVLADMFSDDDLKSFVCKYVMKHWNNGDVLHNFKILRLKRPDLALEILELGKKEDRYNATSMKLKIQGNKEVPSNEIKILSSEAKNHRYFEFYQ